MKSLLSLLGFRGGQKGFSARSCAQNWQKSIPSTTLFPVSSIWFSTQNIGPFARKAGATKRVDLRKSSSKKNKKADDDGDDRPLFRRKKRSGEKYTGGRNSEGLFNGKGTLKYPDGSSYEGGWINGKQHGAGTLTTSDGRKFEGVFKNGEMWKGSGVFVYKNGDFYEGEWDLGFKNGHGRQVYVKTNIEYVGGWQNNERQGRGIVRPANTFHTEPSSSSTGRSKHLPTSSSSSSSSSMPPSAMHKNDEVIGSVVFGVPLPEPVMEPVTLVTTFAQADKVFVGEFRNGKIWSGSGEFVNHRDGITYEGTWKNGVRLED
jgi:hypothetical protein